MLSVYQCCVIGK